jgi:hypothetical protein
VHAAPEDEGLFLSTPYWRNLRLQFQRAKDKDEGAPASWLVAVLGTEFSFSLFSGFESQ